MVAFAFDIPTRLGRAIRSRSRIARALGGLGMLGAVWASPTLAQPVAEVPTTVVPLLTGALVSGDLDGDGDPDLIVAGGDAQGDPATHLYRNDGAAAGGGWAFTRVDAPFAPVSEPTLDLGDLDNDGDLDVLVSGSGVTELYRNDGAFAFVRLRHDLPGLRRAGGIVEVVNTPAARFAYLDGDGGLDLALFGESEDGPYGRVWLGGGDGTLRPGPLLPAFASPSLDVGDLDGDRAPDLVVLGRPSPGRARAVVLAGRDRATRFDSLSTAVVPITLGSARLGDADADGRLDLAVAGTRLAAGAPPRDHSRVYFGVPSATETTASLPTGYYADWIDFDHDGLLDLVVDGSASGSTYLRFLRNTGTGFTAAHEREGVWWGAMERADVDGDGLLDVLLMGEVRRSGQAPQRRFFLLRSTAGRNAPPAAPTIDFASAFGEGETMTLLVDWSPGTDDVTPAEGLSYTVRVGTSPGAGDVLSGAARHLPRRGNAGLARQMTLRDLTPGLDYYVSVQAVDQQHRGSAFSEEVVVRTGISTATQRPDAATAPTLAPAYPNPLGTSTTLDVTVPTAQRVHLAIYDVLGRRVATLVEGVVPAGTRAAQWDATGAPPGLYLARLVTSSGTRTQRLVVAR